VPRARRWPRPPAAAAGPIESWPRRCAGRFRPGRPPAGATSTSSAADRRSPRASSASSSPPPRPAIRLRGRGWWGVVGLLRALERFDPSRGTPFWAYAAWWVRQAMQQLVSELTRPVVLSDRALRQLARVREVHRAALQESGAEPSRGELSARTGLSAEQLDHLLALLHVPRSHRRAGHGGRRRGRHVRRAARRPAGRGRVRARARRDRDGRAAGAAGRPVGARAVDPAGALRRRRRRGAEPSDRGRRDGDQRRARAAARAARAREAARGSGRAGRRRPSTRRG
jgi:hypothetical protein